MNQMDAFSQAIAHDIQTSIHASQKINSVINSMSAAVGHSHTTIDILRARQERYALTAQHTKDPSVRMAYGDRAAELKFVLQLLETDYVLHSQVMQTVTQLLVGEPAE